MTNKEALEFGNLWLQMNEDGKDSNTYAFFQMAIELLKQEPKDKTFDVLRFVADNAGLSIFEAIEKAYNMGLSEQPKGKEFAKFNDFYSEDRATYPPTDTDILIKNHNGDNFIAYLEYDDGEDGGWGFYSENGDFIADVNEIDAWMPIPQHEKDKNYIPIQERKTNDLTSNIDDPGTDEEEIWQI